MAYIILQAVITFLASFGSYMLGRSHGEATIMRMIRESNERHERKDWP